MSLKDRWNNNWTEFLSKDIVWENTQPNINLVKYITANRPARALEVGCGAYPSNSFWLANQGISVTSADISEVAIDCASKLPNAESLNLVVYDVLEDAPLGKYDFIFDYGCFHSFNIVEDRTKFVKKIAENLLPGGVWLSIIGSTEGTHPLPDIGPPRRSIVDLSTAIEPELEIISITVTDIELKNNVRSPAWEVITRRRLVPPTPWIPKSLRNLAD